MNSPVFFYVEANIVCISLAFILIFRELKNGDRQLRNIEFLKTVFVYIVFYIVDSIWALKEFSTVKTSAFINYLIYFFIFFVFTYGSCQWFIYSEVAQGDSATYKLRNRLKWAAPFAILSLCFLIYAVIIYFYGNDNDFDLYVKVIHIFMVLTAFFYELTSSIKSLKRASVNKKHPGKSWYFFMGINPILFCSFVIIQILLRYIPIFCFLNTISMICFYLKGLDEVISIDALTKLNNRNQLNKYFHQIHEDGEYKNYVFVVDVDNFKSINDKYGHIEGDDALILIANTFKEVCGKYPYKCFISRYGGDEFVFVVQAISENDVINLKSILNEKIKFNSEKYKKPYKLSVSIGFSEIEPSHEKLEHCLEIADKKMYQEKQSKAAARK